MLENVNLIEWSCLHCTSQLPFHDCQLSKSIAQWLLNSKIHLFQFSLKRGTMFTMFHIWNCATHKTPAFHTVRALTNNILHSYTHTHTHVLSGR